MPGTRLRVVVVEDEPLARESLVRSLRGIEWIEVVGEAVDGPDATRVLDAVTPDIALMDINLPGYGALRVLREVRVPPAVIFVTAHDQHAVTAFELAAVDYLLKPFDYERLLVALERARSVFESRDQAVPALEERIGRALTADVPLETVFVRDRGSIIGIPLAEIVRFEADDIYIGIFARGRRFLIQMALSDIERRLPPGPFLRVHRSHVINLRSVTRFTPHAGGRFVAELSDGSRVITSRRYSRAIRKLVL